MSMGSFAVTSCTETGRVAKLSVPYIYGPAKIGLKPRRIHTSFVIQICYTCQCSVSSYFTAFNDFVWVSPPILNKIYWTSLPLSLLMFSQTIFVCA